jgi:NAD(P)-dependent dehydrogenase (short-subunit alcohol dehydrogenase family)
MRIAVVDGMGGGIGAQIVQRLKPIVAAPHVIVALGANASATSAMVKAGADIGATGENAIAFNAARVGCIAGPVGIVIPNSMMGEISPAIATAVASSNAVKVLVPLQQAHVEFVGVESKPLSTMLDQLADRVAAILAEEVRQ